MKFLFVGDIVGDCGLEKAQKEIANLRRKEKIDVIIANGENAAERNGITRRQYEALRFAGVDVVTMGNHTWANAELKDFIDTTDGIIRPANYPQGTAGKGYTIIDLGRHRVAVINLMGNVYVSTLPSPFAVIDDILAEIKAQGIKMIIVDLHGEATSEKIAFAHYVDGKVSAVLGTHTHVQTADEQILPKGTVYLTDVGMTGAYESVLGVKIAASVEGFVTQIPTRLEHADGKAQFNAVLFELDDNTGHGKMVERVYIVG